MRYIYAGDRDLSVHILKWLVEKGYPPLALMVTGKDMASHARELIALSGLDASMIIHGKDFLQEEQMALLRSLEPDYIIGIHFPYLVPAAVLNIPRIGFLNLHPAYLPFNKGWHTPSWAILEGTPYGATLHFMTEALDAGDIIHQKVCEVRLDDDANSLYQRVKQVELDVFREAWPKLVQLAPPRSKQQEEAGSAHNKKDLQALQQLDPGAHMQTSVLIDRLRALTTNRVEEAAYFIKEGKKYYIQVKIIASEAL